MNDLYPTKFGVDTLKNFIGADIKNGKMNQKSLELENYFNQVVKAQPGQACWVPNLTKLWSPRLGSKVSCLNGSSRFQNVERILDYY